MSSKRKFLNFSKKKLNFLAFIYLVKTLSQRWVSDFMTPKKSIAFTTCLRRRFYDQVSTSKTSCFWSRFPVSVQRKGIFDIVWFTNQEHLPLFWREIQQGCGWSTFSVARIEIRGFSFRCFYGFLMVWKIYKWEVSMKTCVCYSIEPRMKIAQSVNLAIYFSQVFTGFNRFPE